MKYFIWEYYISLYDDLQKQGFNTEIQALIHYKKYGKYEGRKYMPNESIKNKILYKVRPRIHMFNEVQYLNNNPDLYNKYLKNEVGFNNKGDLLNHYIKIGRLQGRNYVDMNVDNIKINFNLKNKKFIKYPYLFHRYKLGLLNDDDLNKEVGYEVIQTFKKTIGKFYCHIHCFDISYFKKYFERHFVLLNRIFNIVVTYHKGTSDYIKTINITVLKIPNVGMDIGSKFSFIKWLNDSKLDYSYVLFLHSKSCHEAREKYLSFFCKHIKRLRTIKNLLNKNKYDFIFPDMRIKGDYGKRKLFMNKVYTIDLIKYFGCSYSTFMFFEGNVLILSKKICNLIFGDKHIYNVLNNNKSFDYNWVNNRYNLYKDIETTYKIYLKNKLIGNNLELRNNNDNWSDCMIAHAFERIYLNICLSLNLSFFVLSK
jgi:hypothetical protein